MRVINGASTQHRYQTCRNESCERFACRVYAEGLRHGHDDGEAEGHAEGYVKGHSDGHREGYETGRAAGYAEGYAAASRG
jgi:flagellar biosynthesis/type III secretory pathway protein FliH